MCVEITEEDDETVAMIKELLDTRIRCECICMLEWHGCVELFVRMYMCARVPNVKCVCVCIAIFIFLCVCGTVYVSVLVCHTFVMTY